MALQWRPVSHQCHRNCTNCSHMHIGTRARYTGFAQTLHAKLCKEIWLLALPRSPSLLEGGHLLSHKMTTGLLYRCTDPQSSNVYRITNNCMLPTHTFHNPSIIPPSLSRANQLVLPYPSFGSLHCWMSIDSSGRYMVTPPINTA